ncbi:MAG: glycosyltransferase family 2 protein [Patescibacteria group bacterium]|nr:glycosyltransferase family 2 protein [Patescibacteria group bacterium]
MNKNYLSLSKAEDLENPKQRVIYRFLEILPGLLSWLTLLGSFFFSWLSPIIVAIFIILFDFYWLLKIGYLSFHQIASFNKMKKNLGIDWFKKVSQINGWDQIYHLIILPFYKENKEIIESSCQAMLDSDYPKEKIMIVLSVEERAGKEAQIIASQMKEKFSSKFFKFLVTTHPQNLESEVAGKGSNTTWAIKKAKQEIIEPLDMDKDNIIVSTFDIDTKPYPQYFSCLTYHFLTVENPQRCSYQPIPVYNNNIWKAPAFSRVIATSGTFWQMMQQERPEILVTYSSHSTPFKVLEEVGYPKNVVSDDSRIFWKSYLFYDGDYRVIPLYYPVSMDAVLAKNLFKTIINQYKQQRRWAWGCNDIPFMIYGFLKNKKIALSKKISYSFNVLDGFWSWTTASFLIFFLGWLPLMLGGEKFNVTMLSYNLPRFTTNLMRISMIGMIVSSIISLLILPKRPKGTSKFKNLSILLQWLFLPLTLIFFGGIPSLDAQTRLMFKKYLGFWVTEKERGEA